MKRDKHKLFIKIGEARTNKIISMLRLLGNLSNTANYECSDEEVEKMISAIDAEVAAVRVRFAERRKEKENIAIFTFDDFSEREV